MKDEAIKVRREHETDRAELMIECKLPADTAKNLLHFTGLNSIGTYKNLPALFDTGQAIITPLWHELRTFKDNAPTWFQRGPLPAGFVSNAGADYSQAQKFAAAWFTSHVQEGAQLWKMRNTLHHQDTADSALSMVILKSKYQEAYVALHGKKPKKFPGSDCPVSRAEMETTVANAARKFLRTSIFSHITKDGVQLDSAAQLHLRAKLDLTHKKRAATRAASSPVTRPGSAKTLAAVTDFFQASSIATPSSKSLRRCLRQAQQRPRRTRQKLLPGTSDSNSNSSDDSEAEIGFVSGADSSSADDSDTESRRENTWIQ